MSNKISINYEKSIDYLLDKLQLLMQNQDGHLIGDKNLGNFQIKSSQRLKTNSKELNGKRE